MYLVTQYCFRSPDRDSGAGFGPAGLMRTDEKPVPNCPGRRPGQSGTFFVRSHQACGQNRRRTGPGSPVRGPEAALRSHKEEPWNHALSHEDPEAGRRGPPHRLAGPGANSSTNLLRRLLHRLGGHFTKYGPGPGGSGGPRDIPQGGPWASRGPPGLSRRSPGPNANQTKQPGNQHALVKR